MMNDLIRRLSIIINQLSFIEIGKTDSEQTKETHFYGYHKGEFS
jgi:hypothetical protein